MILYFSGTGNTKYAAEVLAAALGDETKDMKELIRQGARVKFYSDKPYMICAPIYALRFPPVVESFLENSDFWGSSEVYFVATCASMTGGAAKYLKKICTDKGLSYRGFAGVRMPENYIVIYKVPSEEEQQKIFRRADDELVRIANTVIRREQLTDRYENKLVSPITGAFNPWFYGALVTGRKFRVTDKCTSCGKCTTVCPYNSIELVGGKPVWANKCTHCMACISGCPSGAIEYGSRTKGKKRYICKRKPDVEFL